MRWAWRNAACVLVVCAGASAWVDRAQEEAFIGKRRTWWSFQKPLKPPVPEIKDRWVRTPVDAFILEALRAKGLAPSPPLDRARLIRRLTLDLTGLPPAPQEVDAFLADNSPGAYEKVVDRLLASPHYGERWAQRWLDVVRYADTNGYELDAERPHAWRYRDYVVRSFNTNKPYDRFLREQIAGDEIWPESPEALIATGFHRAGPIHLVGGNQDEEMNRQEVLTEMAAGVASTFLGLTMGCARCHNHKFDPILQADYYRLQAIFASTEGKDVPLAPREEREPYERAYKDWKARLDAVKKQIEQLEKATRESLRAERKAKLERKYLEVLEIPEASRTDAQKKLAKEANAQIIPAWDEVVAALPEDLKTKRMAFRRQYIAIENTRPEPPAYAYAVQNSGHAPPTHVLKVGDHRHKLQEVDPGFPSVLAADNGSVTLDACSRRAALADWLASRKHPLTARVMVNRIWQMRMGAGLVRTPNDFGMLGERPTNPKLLDWLAVQFMDGGWDVKATDRTIVTSSVYMQASADDPEKVKADPENKLYWRAHRRRLEAETIRDAALAVSGRLNARMGGKPVKAPIEPEVYDLIFTEGERDNLWPVNPDENEHARRSLYLLNKRTVRYPMFANFDQPDDMTSCPRRPVSTHALQALSLMNSDFMWQQARAFAHRIQADCPGDRDAQVRRAYKIALAREPRPDETGMAQEYFQAGGQMVDFCLAMLNRNEFVYAP